MNLKEKLEYHYRVFDRSQLEPDPLQFSHMFSDEKDIEVMAFISSVFAYGSVTQIISILNKLVHIMNLQPYRFIISFSEHKVSEIFNKIKFRFYTGHDIHQFFTLVNLIYNEFGSLKNLFISGYNERDENIKNGISNFSNYFLDNYSTKFGKLSNGFKFMFPLPEKGSACKRMNLFLRWMARKDELDFGLWKEIPTSKLVIPVDTHVARISRNLQLTKVKNVSWKMAEEITKNLKRFDADDPVKYDFAICHIGMRKMEF